MPTAGRARSEQELKQALAEALADARRRTLDLVAPLSRADLIGQHSTIMSPLVWDLAHIGYFEELRAARFEPVRWWTDAHADFGLALARVQQEVGR